MTYKKKKKKVKRDHDEVSPDGFKAHKISLWVLWTGEQEGWNSYLKFWGFYWLLLMDAHLMGEEPSYSEYASSWYFFGRALYFALISVSRWKLVDQ